MAIAITIGSYQRYRYDKMKAKSDFFCGSLVGVLGMYEHIDAVSGSDDVVTIFYPQDTENEFPEYTLVHELTHRELVHGSLIGNLQAVLSSPEYPLTLTELWKPIRSALVTSISNCRELHEAIATYMGFIHQATTEKRSVQEIYQRLPQYYRTALSILETILPNHRVLDVSDPNQYRNILLALGKFSMNTKAIHKLVDIAEPSVESLCQISTRDDPDSFFRKLVVDIGYDKSIMPQLVDIVQQTAVERGFNSVNAIMAGQSTRSQLVEFLNVLDQRLMDELAHLFSSTGNISPTLKERGELVNCFIEKWNAAFTATYGYPLTRFSRFETQPDVKAKIRITPHEPTAASGKRSFSQTPSQLIDMPNLLKGISAAKSLGLWLHIRMFMNPGDRQLSLGPTAPPLKPHNAVLVFSHCLPDAIKTDEDREQILARMEQEHPFCRHHTSMYLPNAQILTIVNELEGVPLLWHVDWIMYNFAKSTGINVDQLPGHKYIHMENADDVTFFELLMEKGEEAQIESYVQYFGQNTILVATFYCVGQPVYYSIPIAEHRYTDFLDAVENVSGHFLKGEEFNAKRFRYCNNMALLYQYGV